MIGASIFNFDLLTDNGGSILIASTNLDQPTSTSVLTVRKTTAGDYRYRCRVDLSELSLFNKTDLYPIKVTGEMLAYNYVTIIEYVTCRGSTSRILKKNHIKTRNLNSYLGPCHKANFKAIGIPIAKIQLEMCAAYA